MRWRATGRRNETPGAEWYDRAAAERFGIAPEEAEGWREEIVARQLSDGGGARERAGLRRQIHGDELLLSRACARGHEGAWEEFWTRYQGKLRAAARALTHESALANELADGLFAELFGLRTRGGERVSKLSSYLGLGSLEGWLRALLAQAHVDHWRRERHWVGLDENDHLRGLLAPPNQLGGEGQGSPALRRQLECALETVLGEVGPAQRLLLSLYFLDGQTLAQIGALLKVHESTVSRRLERAVAQLRKQTRRELGRLGLGAPAAREAMGVDPRWLAVDVRKSLHAVAPGSLQGGPHGY